MKDRELTKIAAEEATLDYVDETEADILRKVKALALCLTLGIFGVHRFYLGKTWTGVLQVLLTISFFGLWINFIWLVIDANRIAFGKLN